MPGTLLPWWGHSGRFCDRMQIDAPRGKGPRRIAAKQAGDIENARAISLHTHLPKMAHPRGPTENQKTKTINKNRPIA